MREKIEVLEHKANMLSQTADQPFLLANTTRSIDSHIAYANGTAFGVFKQVNAAQQRGFTRAARADNRHDLPFLNLEIDTVQHGLPVEFLHQFFDFNRTHFGSRSWRFS